MEKLYIQHNCPSHLSITKLLNYQISKSILDIFLVLGQIFLKKAKRSKSQDDYAIHFGTFEKFLAKNQKNIKNGFGNLGIWTFGNLGIDRWLGQMVCNTSRGRIEVLYRTVIFYQIVQLFFQKHHFSLKSSRFTWSKYTKLSDSAIFPDQKFQIYSQIKSKYGTLRQFLNNFDWFLIMDVNKITELNLRLKSRDREENKILRLVGDLRCFDYKVVWD